MEILSSSANNIEKAAAVLTAGGLVAFPTETVYGLGADTFNLSALARIFEAKNRPRFDPLIIHIASRDTLPRLIDLSLLNGEAREKLALLSEKLWPGPLTLILPKRPIVPDLATAGLSTAAIRFPSHQIAQRIIELSSGAIAAPSANPFGFLSPTRARHVKDQLGEKVDIIIDGGRTTLGVESTVLDLSGGKIPRILRPGGTPREAIEELIGAVELSAESTPESGTSAQLSPGQLKSHYAPRTDLFLHPMGELASLPIENNEGRLYFSSSQSSREDKIKILSPKGDLREAAANLFDMLHELDKMGLAFIRAEEAPASGLGLAINDRLRRARRAGSRG